MHHRTQAQERLRKKLVEKKGPITTTTSAPLTQSPITTRSPSSTIKKELSGNILYDSLIEEGIPIQVQLHNREAKLKGITNKEKTWPTNMPKLLTSISAKYLKKLLSIDSYLPIHEADQVTTLVDRYIFNYLNDPARFCIPGWIMEMKECSVDPSEEVHFTAKLWAILHIYQSFCSAESQWRLIRTFAAIIEFLSKSAKEKQTTLKLNIPQTLLFDTTNSIINTLLVCFEKDYLDKATLALLKTFINFILDVNKEGLPEKSSAYTHYTIFCYADLALEAHIKDTKTAATSTKLPKGILASYEKFFQDLRILLEKHTDTYQFPPTENAYNDSILKLKKKLSLSTSDMIRLKSSTKDEKPLFVPRLEYPSKTRKQIEKNIESFQNRKIAEGLIKHAELKAVIQKIFNVIISTGSLEEIIHWIYDRRNTSSIFHELYLDLTTLKIILCAEDWVALDLFEKSIEASIKPSIRRDAKDEASTRSESIIEHIYPLIAAMPADITQTENTPGEAKIVLDPSAVSYITAQNSVTSSPLKFFTKQVTASSSSSESASSSKKTQKTPKKAPKITLFTQPTPADIAAKERQKEARRQKHQEDLALSIQRKLNEAKKMEVMTTDTANEKKDMATITTDTAFTIQTVEPANKKTVKKKKKKRPVQPKINETQVEPKSPSSLEIKAAFQPIVSNNFSRDIIEWHEKKATATVSLSFRDFFSSFLNTASRVELLEIIRELPLHIGAEGRSYYPLKLKGSALILNVLQQILGSTTSRPNDLDMRSFHGHLIEAQLKRHGFAYYNKSAGHYVNLIKTFEDKADQPITCTVSLETPTKTAIPPLNHIPFSTLEAEFIRDNEDIRLNILGLTKEIEDDIIKRIFRVILPDVEKKSSPLPRSFLARFVKYYNIFAINEGFIPHAESTKKIYDPNAFDPTWLTSFLDEALNESPQEFYNEFARLLHWQANHLQKFSGAKSIVAVEAREKSLQLMESMLTVFFPIILRNIKFSPSSAIPSAVANLTKHTLNALLNIKNEAPIPDISFSTYEPFSPLQWLAMFIDNIKKTDPEDRTHQHSSLAAIQKDILRSNEKYLLNNVSVSFKPRSSKEKKADAANCVTTPKASVTPRS
jgi:hypothetical protein